MKKRTKIVLGIVVAVVVLGVVAVVVDYLRAQDNQEPIFAIKGPVALDGGSTEYNGLGYKVIKCNTLAGDKSAHFGFYSLTISDVCKHDPAEREFSIEDKTTTCDDALELIYEDSEYRYYFGCIKSETTYMVFADGARMSIKEAQGQVDYNWMELVVKKYPEMFYKEVK